MKLQKIKNQKKKSYLKSYKKGLNMNKLNQGDEISILCKL